MMTLLNNDINIKSRTEKLDDLWGIEGLSLQRSLCSFEPSALHGYTRQGVRKVLGNIYK